MECLPPQELNTNYKTFIVKWIKWTERNINLLPWQLCKLLYIDIYENPTKSILFLQADIFKNQGICLKERLIYYVHRGWSKKSIKHSALQKMKKYPVEFGQLGGKQHPSLCLTHFDYTAIWTTRKRRAPLDEIEDFTFCKDE